MSYFEVCESTYTMSIALQSYGSRKLYSD